MFTNEISATSIGRFTLSDERVNADTTDKKLISELEKSWIERPTFDFEFETYEQYLNRQSGC